MFRNFWQTNLIRFSNLINFNGQQFHMSSTKACAPTPSLKDLTVTILDYTNFVKLIGTVTDCHPIVDGFLYTVAQVDSLSKNKIIEHKLNISTQCRNDLALSMLKNGQRINVNGHIRSFAFSNTLKLSAVLAGCRISIIPKTIQLSGDEVNYTEKCIVILQGHVRSDLECDKDFCKFVLETKIAKRNELGELIAENISAYHLIIIKEPKLKKIFEKTIRKYDDVILEGHIDYHSLNSEAVGAIYPYKFLKIDRMAIFARALESGGGGDDDDDDDDDDNSKFDDYLRCDDEDESIHKYSDDDKNGNPNT